MGQLDWTPLAPNLLEPAPVDLTTSNPQLAKDFDYANAIQQVWKEEATSFAANTQSAAVEYQDSEGTKLYGHVIRRKGSSSKVPGIIFFHTGAGPHDICLLWKADALLSLFPEGGVIMIADILSDPTGWAWLPDRTQYTEVRQALFAPDGDNGRPLLQKRIQAAVDALKSVENVDSNKMAAMGWCLGGNPVLEITRMRLPEIKVMASFHGVFGSVSSSDNGPSETDISIGKILVCNGDKDPFVAPSDLDSAIKLMKSNGYDVTLLELEGAKHGFTNPAQDFSPNENFRYNAPGAKKAWTAATKLFVAELQ